MDHKFYADLNPAYPAKGERRYCIFEREDNGSRRSTGRAFNSLKVATKYAYGLTVGRERQRNRIIYPGD